jgi:hypothetical protein
MNAQQAQPQPTYYGFLVPVLCLGLLITGIVALGLVSGNIWVALATGVGLVLLVIAWALSYELRYLYFFLTLATGATLIQWAANEARYAGQWLWILIWLIGGALILRSGLQIRNHPYGHQLVAGLTIVYGLHTIIFLAFAYPLSFYGMKATPDWGWTVNSLFSAPDVRLSALGSYFASAFTSFWGIFYLVLLFGIGQLLVKRWGGLMSLLLLGGVLWAGAGQGGEAGAWIARALVSSPDTWLLDILTASVKSYGSPGYGAIAIGLMAALLMYPAQHELISARKFTGVANNLQGYVGTTVAMQLLQRAGYSIGRVLVSSLFLMVLGIGTLIALWIALSNFATTGNSKSFWLIPNITVPNLSPVWDLSYWALAGIVLLLTLEQARINQARGLANQPYQQYSGVVIVSTFIWVALLGLLAPAGVLLALGVLTLVRSLTILLAAPASQVTPQRKPPPVPVPPQAHSPAPIPAPSPIRTPAPVPAPSPAPIPTPILPPIERVDKTLILDYGSPIAGMVVTNMDVLLKDVDCYLLDCQGYLVATSRDKVIGSARLELASPLAIKQPVQTKQLILLGSGGKVLVINEEAAYQITNTGRTSAGEVKSIQAGGQFDAFAVNGFGTLLAISGKRYEHVNLLRLANGTESVTPDMPQASALAFSPDNRLLGVGTPDGRVFVNDMSTHKTMQTLAPATGSSSYGVVALAATRHGGTITQPGTTSRVGWVVAYDNRVLALCDENGEILEQQRLGSSLTSLFVEPTGGRIAIGCEDGTVQVLSPNLGSILLDRVVHRRDTQVVQVILGREGKRLISAGEDGTIRAVELER